MKSQGAVFAVGATALVIAILELASLGLHRLAYGEPFSYSQAQKIRLALAEKAEKAEKAEQNAERATGAEAAAPDEAQSNNAQVLHPYLGYVLDPQRSSRWSVNEYGFLGELPPFGDEAPEAISVALLGGSVAENTGVFGGKALVDELSRIPAFEGRPIRLSMLALRGMKQPQQLVIVDWLLSLDARFDVVINLDGFNEMVLANENAMQGTHPFYPRRWRVRVEGIRGSQEIRELGRIRFLEDVRADLAAWFADSILRFSITANLVQRGLGERLNAELQDARRALNESLLAAGEGGGYQARGPALADETFDERSDDLADYWRRTSVLLHERAGTAGFRYFHFLQPNQWVEGSKPFDEAERAIARPDDYFHRDTAVAAYPKLIETGRTLREAGVAFTDLTMLFRETSEPRYSDPCCHLNLAGYEEVARAMGRTIREAYARDPGR